MHVDDAIVQDFVNAFTAELAVDVATHLTCREVESLAALLRAFGANEDADYWISYHAEADEFGDEHCKEDA